MSFLSEQLALNVAGVIGDKNVAIYNGAVEILSGNFLFDGVILSANVIEDSRLCEHPVESGVKITDHKVINPAEVTIRFVCPVMGEGALLDEINDLFYKSTRLRIKTKKGFYTNMVLQGLPHEEKAENVDRLVFDLHFKQVLIVTPKFVSITNAKNAQDGDTVRLGENVTKKATSIVKSGLNLLLGGG